MGYELVVGQKPENVTVGGFRNDLSLSETHKECFLCGRNVLFMKNSK